MVDSGLQTVFQHRRGWSSNSVFSFFARAWRDAVSAWLRDPIEINLLVGDETQPRHVRVGRSRGFIALDRLPRGFRPWTPFTSVTISVPVQDCLIRVIQIPRAALSRANEILQVDLERTSPFRDDVLTGWYRPDQDATGDLVILNHVILRQDRIAPLLDAIRALRLPIKAVVPVDGDGKGLPVNLFPASRRSGASALVLLRGVALAGIAALCLFTIAAVWLTISGLDAAQATAEIEVRKATDQAREINSAISKADAFAAQLSAPRLSKIGTTPSVAIWDEVTRLLPQSTWLTTLRIEDDGVHIDGNSSNASELIPLLAASRLFSNVAFASPVTRDPQRGLERFQIKILLANRSEAKAEPTQPVSK